MILKGTKKYNKERFSPKTRRGARNFFDLAYGRYKRPFSDNKNYIQENGKIFSINNCYEYLLKKEIVSQFGHSKWLSLKENSTELISYRRNITKIPNTEFNKKILDKNINYIISNGKIIFEFIYNKLRFSFSIPFIDIQSYIQDKLKSQYIREQFSLGKINPLLGISMISNQISLNTLESIIDKRKFEHAFDIISYNDFLSKSIFLSAKLNENVKKIVECRVDEITEWAILTNKTNKTFEKHLNELVGTISMDQGVVYNGKTMNNSIGEISMKIGGLNLELKSPSAPKWYRRFQNEKFKTEEMKSIRHFINGGEDEVSQVWKRNGSWYW